MDLTKNFDKHNKANGDPPDDTPPEESLLHYETAGNTRNVCFVQPDGKRLFLNYAYLISGEYSPDESSITLAFTTHTVKLTGHQLENLYEGLMAQTVKQIICIDERYMEMKDNKNVSIKNIKITINN